MSCLGMLGSPAPQLKGTGTRAQPASIPDIGMTLRSDKGQGGVAKFTIPHIICLVLQSAVRWGCDNG